MVAKRQHGLIRVDQLHAAGLTDRAIHGRANAGRLYRVHHGVYSLAPPPLSRHQIWLGRPGMGRLATLLAREPGIARSWLEVHFLPVCSLAGVPRPVQNHPVVVPGESRPIVVDFAWPEIALAVELDSQRFHGDWAAAVCDRERDQLLALAGWECHRFVRAVVEADHDAAAGRLRALHAMRLGLRHGGSDPAPRAAGA